MTDEDIYMMKLELEQEMKEEYYRESLMNSDYNFCMEQYLSEIEDAIAILSNLKTSINHYGWDVTIEEMINYVQNDI